MQLLRSICCLLFIAFTVSAVSAPAHALNYVSWVSAGGNNGNPCTRANPCSTFAAAITNTTPNGEVRCLDGSSDFGGATIHQSITIDCHDVAAVVVAACFDIQLTTSGVSDPTQTVKIRGVTCDAQGVSGFGIRIASASAVFLEDMVIVGYQAQGVLDARTHGGVLFIKNAEIRNNGGPGIVAATTGGVYVASLENVHSVRNAYGIAVANGNVVKISHSEFSNNVIGIESDAGGQIGIDSSLISYNSTGLQNNGVAMLFSNSEITFNSAKAISGPTFTFGNNRIYGNSTLGTPPTPVGQQ